jgi:hypothetical protein
MVCLTVSQQAKMTVLILITVLILDLLFLYLRLNQ